MKRQGIYWLTSKRTEKHEEMLSLLEEQGFGVVFYTSLEELRKELQIRRVSIIIVGDEDEEQAREAMESLATMPDIQGARLFLSISAPCDQLCKQAARLGFRDILALDLEFMAWFDRFQFSIGQHLDRNVDTNLAESSIQEVKVGIPARIAWVSSEKIWLETRARPDLDKTFDIIGPMAEDMGCDSLQLVAESKETQHLVYRFSEASICRWHGAESQENKIEQVLTELRKSCQGAKKKVFLAIQSPALRSAITKYISSDEFEVHSALQKKSLITEPRYFSPSLVFAEFRLFSGESMSRFQEMVSVIPEQSTVVLVGAKPDEVQRFHNFALGRRVEALFQVPKNLVELIDSKFLKDRKPKSHQQINLPRTHKYSHSEIIVSAEILRSGSQYVELKLPIKLANYGLVRLELSDKSSIYAKVIHSSIDHEEASADRQLVVCRTVQLGSKKTSF